MQTGQRGRTPVAPGNATGRRFAELQHEQEARKRAEEAGPVDLEALRKSSFMAGWNTGYDAGYDAAIRQFRAEDEPEDQAAG